MSEKELVQRGSPRRKSERQQSPESRRYYDPVLLFFTGLPFSGKTALGVAIEAATNIRYFDVDETRSELWGQMNGPLPGMGEWHVMVSSYDENHSRAAQALSFGVPVAVGATYSRTAYHERIRKLAEDTGVPVRIFRLQSSQDSVRDRLMERIQKGSASNLRSMEHYQSVVDRYVWIKEDSLYGIADVTFTDIDTSQPIEVCLEQIYAQIEEFRYKKEKPKTIIQEVLPFSMRIEGSFSQEEAQRLGNTVDAPSMGVSCLIKTSDNMLVIGQRNTRHPTKEGGVHSVGGRIESKDIKNGQRDILGALGREIQEEVGISQREWKFVECLGVMENKTSRAADVLFVTKTPFHSREIQSRSTDDELGIRFIPDTPRAVRDTLLQFSATESTPCMALLLQYGKERFGDEWYRYTRSRLAYRLSRYKEYTPSQHERRRVALTERLTRMKKVS